MGEVELHFGMESGVRGTVRWATRIERCPRSFDRLLRIFYLFQQVREGAAWRLPEFRDAKRMHPIRLLVSCQKPRLDSFQYYFRFQGARGIA